MNPKNKTKITLILGFITILIVPVGFFIYRSATPLYRLDHTKSPSEAFETTHIYLKELQQLRFSGSYDERKLARTEKALNKRSFISLVNALIENGYTKYTTTFSGVDVRKRTTTEDEQNIIVSDTGEWSLFNDTTLEFGTGSVSLKYRYNKQTGNIYFETDFGDLEYY